MPIFFQKANGKPVAGSNRKYSKKPSNQWSDAQIVVDGPLGDTEKESFEGANRYFVQFDSKKRIINRSLVVSTTVPEGNYLEIFANDLITLPLGSDDFSGLVPDAPEDVDAVDVLVSYEYTQNNP